jgi:hypothetical protein
MIPNCLPFLLRVEEGDGDSRIASSATANDEYGGVAQSEIRQRTRVVTIFPNTASSLHLVSALLMEADKDWQMGKRYLTFSGREDSSN